MILSALFISILTAFAAEEKISLPVIDTHTHAQFSLLDERTSGIPVTFDEYIKEMKEAGVVGAISHTSSGGRDLIDPRLKDLNVISCYGVGEKINLADIEKQLKNKKFQCVKIYLGYIKRYAYDKAYRPIYALAGKYDVPVVFHTGDTYSKQGKVKYSDPMAIDEVAVDFPKTTFVIAHLGNPWIETAAEVVYKNDNVFVEASALLIGDMSDKEKVEQYLIKPVRWAFGYIENPSKFMFGTDWPLVNMKDYLEAYKKAIPKEHWCKVFFENPVKVFRLKKVAEKYTCQQQ